MTNLQFAACDLSNADLDVEKATSEFNERLNRLHSHMQRNKNASDEFEGEPYDVDSEITTLQRLAEHMSSLEFISHMKSCADEAEAAAKGDIPVEKQAWFRLAYQLSAFVYVL